MKRQKTAPRPKPKGRCAVFTGCLLAFTSRVGDLDDLKTPQNVREWLLMSQSELGAEVGKLARHDHAPLGRSAICQYEHGKKMAPRIILAYASLVANKLRMDWARPVEIQIAVNSPWKVDAFDKCAKCGKFFKLRHHKSTQCPECRK